MRTLLINPELPLSFWSFRKATRLRGHKAVIPPLGLLTVAALLPSEWEMRLVDLNTSKLSEADWHWADVIMISSMYIQKTSLETLTEEAKFRRKTVVAGGPYPTMFPEETLKAGCDFVLRGEGENTIPLLLKAMRDRKLRVIENDEKPDLSASPIPLFDLLKMNDYRMLTIQTSRGCPFDCEFCDIVHLFGRKIRYKTPEQVIAELESLYRLGARGDVFICDDNFIGSEKQARAILHELIPWLESRGKPFRFTTQVPVNLGQDQEMLNLMTAANFERVFIGIESPDVNVLESSRKYHNITRPLLNSLNNIRQSGIEVIGSFIIGFDGEATGAGERVCAFVEKTNIPLSMLGVLQALPRSSLWFRMEREGRLRDIREWPGGSFARMNFRPNRPESEILQEYIDVWEYLYEPSRYLERAYRYFLEMPPAHQKIPAAAVHSQFEDGVLDQIMILSMKLKEIKVFLKIIWWQGILAPYRRQFWTQLIGMWKQNSTRLPMYIKTIVMGLDLFPMRKTVREKVSVIMKEHREETPPSKVWRYEAVQ